jgi:hypothetical protein
MSSQRSSDQRVAMTKPNDPSAENKPALVDVVHEWLGQSGLRKIWGLHIMHYPDFSSPDGAIRIADIFLRENDVPYFIIWPYTVIDKGSHDRQISVSAYDPEFFEKLRKMLDYREQSNTIICRCSQCEGTKR